MSLPLILLLGGLVLTVWILFWSLQRSHQGDTLYTERAAAERSAAQKTHPATSAANGLTAAVEDAVLVSREHGQLIYVNDAAQRWLGLGGTLPRLDVIAHRVSPSDNFWHLFADEGQTFFQVAGRWVEASSHRIPAGDETRTVIVMRELTAASNGHAGDALNLNEAMTLINEIGETVNSGMGVEQVLQTLLSIVSQAIPFDAGEICLWDETAKVLHQRGWVGDALYLILLAEAGGSYDLDEGISGWVARQRKPVMVNDLSDPSAIQPKLHGSPYQSFLAVPLTVGERFLGTVELASSLPHAYTQRDLALLQAVSKPIAVTVLNATIYADQVKRVDDLASLQQIAADQASDENATAIYAALNARVAALLNADMCGVFLYDPDEKTLYPELPFHGLPDALVRTIDLPLPPDSPQRDIWEHQSYWVSNDVVDEPLIEALGMQPLLSISGINNTAWFPLQVSGRRLGVLAVSNKRTEGGFTPRDIQNLTVLAAQAAIIVENIRLFQRERRIDTELAGLQEITHAIGALSHEGEFYSEITERIARLMEINMCGILLYDDYSRRLVAKLPFYGLPNHLISDYAIDVSPGTVMAELWENEDTWYSNRVRGESLVYEAGLDQLATQLGVEKTLIATLAASGNRLGVVQISNKADGSDFTDSDARLLLIFATQTAAIIENARLFRDAQRSAEEAQGLRRVAELAGAVLTTQEKFAPVLAEIARLLNSEMVFVNVLDHQTGALITYPRWVHGSELTEPIVQDIYSKSFEQSVAVSHRPYLGNDVPNDDRVLPGYRSIAQKLRITRAILVPLTVGDRTLGELGVANRQNGVYTNDDLTILRVVAAQTASALDRLLLLEATGNNLDRRNEELEAISRVSNELAQTVELDTILNTICVEAQRATRASGSTVALFLSPTEWRSPEMPVLQRRLGPLEGVTNGLAEIEIEAATRYTDTVLITDYEFSTLNTSSSRIRSAMAAPIVYLDIIVGVIHLYHHEPNRFDDRAAAFLTTMASKAALGYTAAMRFAEQFERSERQRRRLEQLNRIFDISHMSTNTDPEEILEAIAYSVQGSVGFDSVVMLLVDEETNSMRRIAQAGLPLEAFEQSRSRSINLDNLARLLRDQYRVSDVNETYFFPVEAVADWYIEDIQALSTAFDGNRTIELAGRHHWRDGDMLIVTLRGATGHLLGVMSLDRPQDNRRPDRQTVEVLEIFAHQASTSIENTRLYQSSVRSAEQESRLSEIVEVMSRSLDIFEIFEALAQGLPRLVPFSRLTMGVSDPQTQGYEVFRVQVKDREVGSILRDRRPDLAETALNRAMIERRDFEYRLDDPTSEDYDDLSAWKQQGLRCAITLPLQSGSEVLGVIAIGGTQLALLESRGLLWRLAQIVASNIQNARLLNQALNLRMLNESVIESIQQGIVVLNSSGRIRNANLFMCTRFGWDETAAIGQDLFEYDPNLAAYLSDDLQHVLNAGEPRELLNSDHAGTVRNYYLYPLRSGEAIRGAVMLVEDVTVQAELERANEMRANQLQALTEVSNRITSSLERVEVVNVALQEMRRLIQFDTMTLWQRNGSYMVQEGRATQTSLYISKGSGQPEVRVRFAEFEQARLVVETQRSVVARSMPQEQVALPGHDHTTIGSWMGVPLVNQGHVVGMMVLSSPDTHLFDSASDQNIAFAFASQVAIALANAELFEQTFDRTNELGTLLEAAQATSLTQDLDSVFRTVVELMFSALDMDDCAIMLWDEVDNAVEVQVDMNRFGDEDRITPKGTRYDLDRYPARAKALRERDVVVITRYDIDSPYPSEIEALISNGDTARMLVPLVVRERTIGLIQLEQASEEQKVTQQKVRLAKALGSQVAVAIENARLSAAMSSQFTELMIINDLSRAISSTLDLDEMIDIVGKQVPNVTGADELYLALYDQATETITFPLAVRGGERYNMPPRVLGDDEVSFVIKRQRPLSLGADYYSPDELRKNLGITNGEGDIRSYMGYPVSSGGKVLGVLALRDSERTHAFTINDQRILETVSAQLGTAIQNARLFTEINTLADSLTEQVRERTAELQSQSEELEEERDRLDTLYQITSELARTLDMDRLLNRALTMVSKAVSAEDGAIVMIDQMSDKLYSRAFLNPNSLRMTDEGERVVHPAELLAQYLIDQGEGVFIANDLHEAHFWQNRPESTDEWRSALAVLLETNEDPIGVLVLFSRDEGTFGEAQLKLVEAASNQVASAFNNADLYHLIKDQAERLGMFLKQEQEETEKTNAILEGINEGVILADTDGRIVVFNAAAERILNVPRNEVKGTSIVALLNELGGGALNWARAVERSNLTSGKEYNPTTGMGGYEDERLALRDRVLVVQLTPLTTNGRFIGTVSLFRDITRDVELDRRKSQFIANVSHEFRTPLTPIKGYTDLLIMGAAGEVSDPQKRILVTIKENIDRLTALVEDVLKIADIDAGKEKLKIEMFNLNEVVEGALGHVRAQHHTQKHLNVRYQPALGLPFIEADREKVNRIIANIIDNAFNYTPADGSVEVKIIAQEDGEHVMIAVSDTGVGIPPEIHESVWNRFERHDQTALTLEVAGTGLGLPIVRELVEMHSGKVWFESEVDRGTTFYVELPMKQPNYFASFESSTHNGHEPGDN